MIRDPKDQESPSTQLRQAARGLRSVLPTLALSAILVLGALASPAQSLPSASPLPTATSPPASAESKSTPAAESSCLMRTYAVALKTEVLPYQAVCLSDEEVQGVAALSTNATWLYGASPATTCTMLTWVVNASIEWYGAPCYGLHAEGTHSGEAPRPCHELAELSARVRLDLCGPASGPEFSQASTPKYNSANLLSLIRGGCNSLVFLSAARNNVADKLTTDTGGSDPCRGGPKKNLVDTVMEYVNNVCQGDCSSKCDPAVAYNPTRICGVVVPNPCPTLVQSNPTRVCGVTVPNACPQGVDANTAKVCVATLCPSGVSSPPGPGQVAKVCGTGVTNPCPTGVQSNPTRVCGVPVPNACPQGVDANTAKVCVATLCPTGVTSPPGPGQLTKVCGTGVSNPCPTGVQSNPTRVCGVPIPDACPQGVDTSTAKVCLATLCPTGVTSAPGPGQIAKVCGEGVANPCSAGVDANHAGACGLTLCPAGVTSPPGPSQLLTLCGFPVPSPGGECDHGKVGAQPACVNTPPSCGPGEVGYSFECLPCPSGDGGGANVGALMTCAGATNLVDQYLTCMSKAGLNNVAHGQAVGPSQIDPACEIIGGQAKSVISQVNSQAELVKSSIPKGPCAKSLFDFQADLASHTYLFVAPTSFDPATEYNLPTGSTFAKWDPRDYSCIFPSHKELDDATVVPSAYLLDPKVQSALANQGNPTETCVPAPPVTDCPSAAGPSTMMAHHHGGNSIGLPSPAPGLPMQTTSSSSTTPFYSENFDSGSASGWSLSGLWHPSSCQAVSGGYSLGYNQPGCPTNYDVGTTAGEAISPPISIPSDSSSVVLSWNSWHQTESGTYWDTKIVYVSMDGSAFQQLDQEDGTQQAWNAKTKDLSAYVGHTIQIKFVFKSGDDLYNDGQGWFIDDVLVSGVTGVPSNQGGYIPADLFFENFDQALPGSWSYSGLWTLNLCQSVSQPWSMVYSTRPGYGRDCPKNFDVGTTAGNAITSTISVPSGSTNVRLSWRSWHDTESGTSYDQKKVFVSSDGGASWAQVWQEDGTQQVWNSRSVDLSSYAGTNILVKFSFDSVDGLYNQGEGWSVDDVKITASVPSNDHCPGSSYYFPRGLAGMCTNVRAGPSGGPITLSVLVPNWGDSQATDTSNPCQYDHAREAADYLQITSVQFNVICVFGWNTEQTAGFGYPYSDDDCAWSSGTSGAYSSDGYSEDAHTLLNRAFHYAKWNGLIDQPNQAVLAWVHEATSAGMACPWSFPWAVALAAERADYCFNGSCNTFPLTGLALHEVAHLFAAAHSPADDWRKYDCNQGDGVMNYCDMAFGARNFTQEGLERVANNIIDDAP